MPFFALFVALMVSSIVPLPGEIMLPALHGQPGRLYYLETATDITGPWTRVTDCEELPDGSVRLWSHGAPQFFVRLTDAATYQK